MPLCSAATTRTGGTHTPTSFCGRDKVAAIRPRGSALQLASCRLGDDCQGPSGGRINSSCSAWRCAGPVGALAAARGQTTPLVLSGEGGSGSSPRAARKTRQFGSCGLRVVLTHGPRGGAERSQEMTGGECHKLATLSSGFLFLSSFFFLRQPVYSGDGGSKVSREPRRWKCPDSFSATWNKLPIEWCACIEWIRFFTWLCKKKVSMIFRC